MTTTTQDSLTRPLGLARDTHAKDARASAGRLPVVGCERRVWSEIAMAERAQLRGALFRIFNRYYTGVDEHAFAQLLLERDDVVLGLLRGREGELAGFVTCVLNIIPGATRDYGVFSAGVYIDTRYRGGNAASRFGLREALRVRLRHPRLRLAYLAVAKTPAPYRLYTKVMPRVYPSRSEHSGEPRGEIAEVMAQALAKRGWGQVGGDPLVVATPLRVRDDSWLERSKQLRDDPDVAFYCARVPGWACEGHAMGVWVSLELPDLLRGAVRLLRKR